MKKQMFMYCFVVLLLVSSTLRAEEIRFPVRHPHAIGSCKGELIFTETGIEFAASDKKHSRTWKYIDLQQVGLLGAKEISILTYEDQRWKLGKDRDFRFELTGGEINPALWAMLQTKVSRPLVSAVLPSDIKATYQIPVKHQHGFGGTQGTLELSEQYIIYKTEAKADSRIWRYEDISSIGTTGPYELRLTSMDRVQGEYGGERSFVFALKERLKPEIYDFLWWKINGPQISYASRK
jgi:hypothetical protein